MLGRGVTSGARVTGTYGEGECGGTFRGQPERRRSGGSHGADRATRPLCSAWSLHMNASKLCSLRPQHTRTGASSYISCRLVQPNPGTKHNEEP